MQSPAKTVSEYLSSIPGENRDAIEKVRDVILKNIPAGYEETMNWGMICYEVPLSICPETYNGKPLMYAALAVQKRHMSLYLTPIYMSQESSKNFEKEYRATGKRFDAGKSCVRFKKIDDLPLDLIAKIIASMSIDDFVLAVKSVQSARRKKQKY